MRSFLDYAVYLAFFPQLLAGPIVRAGRFFSEWRRKLRDSRPLGCDLGAGACRVLVGLVKKTCLADRFALLSNAYFANVHAHPGALAASGATFAFAKQIYFDFLGYSDIAIRLAHARVPFSGKFPTTVPRLERFRVLPAMAHDAVVLVAGLSLYPARGQS